MPPFRLSWSLRRRFLGVCSAVLEPLGALQDLQPSILIDFGPVWNDPGAILDAQDPILDPDLGPGPSLGRVWARILGPGRVGRPPGSGPSRVQVPESGSRADKTVEFGRFWSVFDEKGPFWPKSGFEMRFFKSHGLGKPGQRDAFPSCLLLYMSSYYSLGEPNRDREN